jgi:oxaloacetate decarboxylase (Na+ extruding) subunit gamma
MLELITSGVELMLAGMGIVFAFLAMLIGAINVMSGIISRFYPEPPNVETPVSLSTDKATVAAISAAVHQYRTKYK